MRVQIDCYPCVLSQLSRLAKMATPDLDRQYELVRRMLRKVVDADDRTTPPEFASFFNRIVSEVSGIEDAYREVKDKSTQLGLELLPELRQLVDESSDPFEAAVRLAIGGNLSLIHI